MSSPVLVGGDDWDKCSVIAPGDLNADGYADLLLRDNASGDIYRTYGQQGEKPGVLDPTTWGSPASRVKVGTGFPAATYPVIASDGDITGDTVPDVWARRSDNILVGWPGATGGATGFSLGQSPFTISATQPTTPSNPTPGRPDMSGDTLADMVVQTTDGTLSIRRKQTSGPYFDTGTQVSWGWQDYFGLAGQGALYFADIDGDGAKDLISLGTDGTITVRKNNGNGTAFDTGTLTSATGRTTSAKQARASSTSPTSPATANPTSSSSTPPAPFPTASTSALSSTPAAQPAPTGPTSSAVQARDSSTSPSTAEADAYLLMEAGHE